MISKKNWITVSFLLLFALLIRLISGNAAITENLYSTGVYPAIAIFFRFLLGWIPFSIGDILYGAAAFWILWKLFVDARMIFKGQFTRAIFLKKSFHTFEVLLIIYIIFNVLWGINYNRQGIATQLDLSMNRYTTEELKTLNTVLIKKVNASKAAVLRSGNTTVLKSNTIFDQSKLAYIEASKKYSFLNYKAVSVKVSLWGWLGNYMGFNGYYNPFTGEAQVNTTVPKFSQPFTTCHEMAHQLGYAKENEANFVGYLSASSSKDSAFLYSTYLDLFLYADKNLFAVDSVAGKACFNELLPAVKKDIMDWLRTIRYSERFYG